MNAPRLTAAVILALMVTAAVAAVAWRPTQYLANTRPKVVLDVMFPKAFGEWREDNSGPVQLVSPEQEALINRIYNQTLSRVYVSRDGQRIMLSVAYGGDQSDATRAHRPEVCYPAQGFQVRSNHVTQLEVGDRVVSARLLDTKLGGRQEPLTYWISIADITTTGGTEQKLAQIRYGLKGIIPDGMLVRVSSIDSDPDRAHRRQLEFVRALAASVDPEARTRIFGAAASRKPADQAATVVRSAG